MKRFMVILALLSGFNLLLYAANTCTNSDLQCYQAGPSGSLNTRWRLDASGNQTNLGALNAQGVVTVTGSSTTSTGLTVFSPTSYTGIAVATTVQPTSTYMVWTTSGGFPGDIKMTSTPTISTATAVGGTTALPTGTMLMITGGTTNQITIQDNATLSGSALQLVTPTIVITSTKTYEFIFNGSSWTVLRGGNQP